MAIIFTTVCGVGVWGLGGGVNGYHVGGGFGNREDWLLEVVGNKVCASRPFSAAYCVSGAFETCTQHRPCHKTPRFPHFHKIPDV